MKHLPYFLFSLLFLLLLLIQNCNPGVGQLPVDPIPDNAWKMPEDVPASPSRHDWLQFGWETFIALNWPADNNWPLPGNGGKPDMNLNITDKEAANRHAVWQTYLEPGQLFLAGGAAPGTWDNPVQSLHTKSNGQDLLPVLGGFGEKGLFFINEDPEVGLLLYDLAITPNPVIDQNKNYVLLEVRLNQSEFQYFKETGYYDACKQSAALAASPTGFKYLPQTGNGNLPEWAQQGAVEIKASWKILEPEADIAERYFTTEGYYLSPTYDTLGPYTLGLVGLHIMRNTPRSSSTWYWTTFEQVDNVKIYDKNPPRRPDGQLLSPSFNPGPAGAEPEYYFGYDTTGRLNFHLLDSIKPPNYGNPVIKPERLDAGVPPPPKPERQPVDCSRVAPIPADVQNMNRDYQARLAGTPWQYYEMIDALFPTPNGNYRLLQPDGQSSQPAVYANTPALINTTMETYLAYKPSTWNLDNCLTCHYDASPRTYGNEIRKKTSLQVFSYLYRRALPSTPDSPGFFNCLEPPGYPTVD